jgi:hypothetical protein
LSQEQLALFPAEMVQTIEQARRLEEDGDRDGAIDVLRRWRASFGAKVRTLCLAGQVQAAKEYLREYYDPVLNLPFVRPLAAQSLIDTAARFRSIGEHPSVCQVLLEEAVRVSSEIHGEDHADVGHALLELAKLRRELGDLPQAEDLCRRALKIHARLGDHPLAADNSRLLADIIEARQRKGGSE